MTQQIWHIPANYTDAGKLFGLFAIRNAIEALLLAGPSFYFAFRFLPFTVTTNLMLALLHSLLNRRSAAHVKLPEGIFGMATQVAGFGDDDWQSLMEGSGYDDAQ